MLVKFSNHIPHLVVGTLLLPDRESAKIHSNQANPIIRGPNQSLTSPTGMHNSLPLLNPNYSIGNVHPIENETFNTLKNAGYNLEHNFGHGYNQLSTVFASLMMLAFLIDQAEQRCCKLFRMAREKAERPLYFWEELRSHVFNFEIPDWEYVYKMIAFGYRKTTPELIDTS